MNKFLIVAAAFAVVVASTKSDDQKNMEECKAETGATDEDIRGLKPFTEKRWCLMGCIDKKIGVIGADNKINLDKVQQVLAEMKVRNPERYEKLMPAAKSCKSEVESKAANIASVCTAAKAMAECMDSKM